MDAIDKLVPVAFITDRNFIVQTHVAITSLVCSKKEKTEYDIFIIAADCDDSMRSELKKIDTKGCRINIVEASTDKYIRIKQIAHIPIACLLKFEICDYIIGYEKLIYLDGDIIVRGDLSELCEFDMGEAYIAGVPSVEMIYSDKKMINAGVMLFNARKMRDDHMSSLLIEKRQTLGDKGSMDQQTFNLVMSDSMRLLPWMYNFIPDKIIGSDRRRFECSKLNKLYGTSYSKNMDFKRDALIIHYATGYKPWNYDFIKCGNEWINWYQRAGFKESDLNRKNWLQARKEFLKSKYEVNGLKGLIKDLWMKTKKSLGIRNTSGDSWG